MEQVISNPIDIKKEKIHYGGIDLLKLIAMLFICLSHAIQTAGGFITFFPTSDPQALFCYLFRALGALGNIIFILCSTWFLLDSSKPKSQKIFNILLDSCFISIICLIGMLCGGYKYSAGDIFHQIFPDLFGNVWFIPCYVLFYAFTPLINLGLKHFPKKWHFLFLIITTIFYGCFIWFGWVPQYVDLIFFIVLYIDVAYLKKYHPNFNKNIKANILIFVITTLLYFGCLIGKNFLDLKFDFFINRFNIGQQSSLFLVLIGLSLFNLFSNLKFQSKCISYLASTTLFIYCFHENILLASTIRPKFYQYIFDTFGNQYFSLWILLCGVGMFIGFGIVAIIYKETFHRLTTIISKWLSKITHKFFNWFYNKIEKTIEDN